MELTKEQIEFHNAEGKVVLCACPGSGKTFIVGKKLFKYLSSWQHSYRGVAVLSFTNVASDEILRQVSESAGENDNIGFPHYVGTLDSFINNFVFLRFGYLTQRTNQKRPKILFENVGEMLYAKKECYKNGCASNLNWFSWSDEQLLKNGKPIDCNVQKKPCVQYKKMMLQNGFINQNEVAALTLRLLKHNPEIAERVAHRFPIIIVDEAQDTSKEQMEILELLAENGVTTFILVGDPDQAIYEWRDATPEFFEKKIMDEQWKSYYLTENFRSSQHICNATSVFSHTLTQKNITMIASGDHRTFSQKSILYQVKNNAFDNVVADFKIVCADNEMIWDSEKVAMLTRHKIHEDSDIHDLWQHHITEWLAMATFFWHCGSRKEAYRLCEKALYEMSVSEVSELSSDEIKIAIEKKEDYAVWRHKVVAVLRQLPPADSAVKVWRQNLITRLNDLMQQEVFGLRNGVRLDDIIKVKTRDKQSDGSFSNAFLDKPVNLYFEKKSKRDITISSIHGVKGETYDAVLLIANKTRGNALKSTDLFTGTLTSEIMRIAYVAMTRPRKLLGVAVPYSSKNNLSRFSQEEWEYRIIE